MAITLTQPVTPDIAARLERLAGRAPTEAQALANLYNAGTINLDAFGKAVDARFAHLTSSDSARALSSQAARFANRVHTPDQTALLASIKDAARYQSDPNMRGRLVGLIPVQPFVS